MKSVVRIKLLPDGQTRRALAHTLTLANRMSTRVAEVAFERGIYSTYDLRKVVYRELRDSGLGSQAAQQAVRKTAAAYKTRKANARNGNYGKKDSERYARVMGKPIAFRDFGAHPFDDRNLSWDHTARTVSIWTTAGRMVLPFTGHPGQLLELAAHRKGESDLSYDKTTGNWYLIATIERAEPDPTAHTGFIGVDMGMAVLAATATEDGTPGQDWSGGAVTLRRKKNRHTRKKLQAKGTKSAKRLLKKRSKKEARFATDTNHVISKTIVAEAKRTGRGVAVEELTGIRDRVRHRKPQRATFHSWAFAQLGSFLAYKSRQAGVAFVQVDPAHTSQQCSRCGHTARNNRRNQADFCCRACGISLNADHNAAINIARRGVDGWQGAVNHPNAA